MGEKHRVVILGGGFGGLAAAQKLKRASVEVTLIDRRNFHLFQPLLYQVATGSLSPGEIAAPLRGVLSKQKNVQVLMGEAVDVDPQAKRVFLRDGATFEYDSLIVATGTQTSYYGNDSWREWAPSVPPHRKKRAPGLRSLSLEPAPPASSLQVPWLRSPMKRCGTISVRSTRKTRASF